VINILSYTIAITGASGVIYAKRLLEFLVRNGNHVDLILSETAKEILKIELGVNIRSEKGRVIEKIGGLLGIRDVSQMLRYYESKEIDAPLASGSNKSDGMVIVPCSMGTLSRVALGMSTNLIERAADVMLKEKRTLVLVPRETPLNAIHLRNMLSLAEMGVHILPAMPAFYYQPESIDDLVNFMVGRILDLLKVEHNLYKRWKEYD